MLTAESIAQEQTLSDIDRKEVARRQRALRYESLLGDRTRLTETIRRLEPKVKRAEHEEKTLVKLNRLVRELDKDTRTSEIGLPARESEESLWVSHLPAGLSLVGFLPRVIEGALIAHRRMVERFTREHRDAIEALARVETALAVEFPSHQEAQS